VEEIFYAILALHMADKPINKDNIQTVLRHAGTPVNGSALDALAAFVESLEIARTEKGNTVDPRIIKFLTSELAQRKVQTKRLEALLEELTKNGPLASDSHEGRLYDLGAVAQEDEGTVGTEEGYDGASKGYDGAAAEVLPQDDEASVQFRGRYVYGIAKGSSNLMLGPIGLDGRDVYTIPYLDIIAIVHDCPSKPYQSSDDEVVKSWVKNHQKVLDAAKERFGTIIPMGFDTIFQPKDNVTAPEQVVKDWLKENHERLRTIMERVEGKDEYVVQVSYEPGVIAEQVSEQSEEIRRLKEDMAAAKAPGAVYLYRQKLEKALRAETDRLADRWFRDFFEKIKSHTDDIVVERTKKLDKNKAMLLNLSCLIARDKVAGLGEELEKIEHEEGFSVHFSGPWPPYSFVAKPIVLTQGE